MNKSKYYLFSCLLTQLFSNNIIADSTLLIDDVFEKQSKSASLIVAKNQSIQDELDEINRISNNLLRGSSNYSSDIDIPISQPVDTKSSAKSANKKRLTTPTFPAKNQNPKPVNVDKQMPLQHEIVKTRLLDWADAWSQGNVNMYLDFYDSNYSPYGKSRQDWIQNRKQRISAKKNIRVELSEIKINAGRGSSIVTRFKQKYSSIHFQDTSYKLINWKKKNSNWFISREITVKK